jgi:hypothetical protein
MESFKLPMIVLMREPSHDELFYSPPKNRTNPTREKKQFRTATNQCNLIGNCS